MPEPSETVDDLETLTGNGAHDKGSAEAIEERKQRIYQQKQYVTGRIGETSRFIGFGLLAVFYTLHTSDNEFAARATQDYSMLIYVAGLTGGATVLFDYFQYLAGNFSIEKALSRKDGLYLYNDGWISYRLRVLFYYSKQLTAAIGATALIFVFASVA